jgi:four helix bundle protein
VLNKNGQQFLAVVIPMSKGRPHFARPAFMRQGAKTESSLEESRYHLILASDSGYGQTDHLSNSAEEVSRLLNAYARAILASGS